MEFKDYIPVLIALATGIGGALIGALAGWRVNDSKAVQQMQEANEKGIATMRSILEESEEKRRECENSYRDEREAHLTTKSTLMAETIKQARQINALEKEVEALWAIIEGDKRLAALLEFIPFPVIMTNGGTRIARANRQAVLLFGWPEGDLIGMAAGGVIANYADLTAREYDRSQKVPITVITRLGAELECSGRFMAFRDGAHVLQYVFIKHPVEVD
jgi:PAS domain-containing protein